MSIEAASTGTRGRTQRLYRAAAMLEHGAREDRITSKQDMAIAVLLRAVAQFPRKDGMQVWDGQEWRGVDSIESAAHRVASVVLETGNDDDIR